LTVPELDYGMFDVDNHFYEADDAFTRYIEPAYQDRAVRWVTEHGLRHVMVSGRPAVFFESHGRKPAGQEAWVGRPGSLKELLRSLRQNKPAEGYLFQPVAAEFLDRDRRLALMDQQGIEACMMFPGTAVSVEHFFETADELYANFSSYNRWVQDDWGFAYKDRIFSPAMLSLRDLDMALAELDRVMVAGAKVIGIGPGPAYGRSPADPYFDPFWARINEAGLTVAIHLTESGYTASVSPLWGEDPNPANYKMSAWQWFNTYGDMPAMATITSLVYGNLFGRYPNIKVAIVEHGAEWLPYLMTHIDKMRGMGRNGPWIGGPLQERPTAVMRRHVVVTPFPEDDVAKIVDEVGPEMIALGSDFPHPEGLAEPKDFQKMIDHLPYQEQKLILRDNGMRLVGR
jgi:predicted TIM-barrel fold metal-dependent hydrolase